MGLDSSLWNRTIPPFWLLSATHSHFWSSLGRSIAFRHFLVNLLKNLAFSILPFEVVPVCWICRKLWKSIKVSMFLLLSGNERCNIPSFFSTLFVPDSLKFTMIPSAAQAAHCRAPATRRQLTRANLSAAQGAQRGSTFPSSWSTRECEYFYLKIIVKSSNLMICIKWARVHF